MTESGGEIVIPDMEWYLNVSARRGVTPRCPFASVERCPRYFESLSLLGQAGSTKIPPEEDERLVQLWKQSDLWPKTAEGSVSIAGSDGKYSIFSNFCPEVSYDRFGLFASSLIDYADEIDRGIAHERLGRDEAPSTDWRWRWTHIKPLHFTECPMYSPLTRGDGLPSRSGEDKRAMNDNEARGLILRRVYDRRDTGRFVNVNQLDDLGFNRVALDRYLTQLDETGLITLKPLRDHSGLVDAMIQITSYGTDSIEHPETSPPNIVVIGDVHIGDNKTQNVRMGVGKIEAAMDHSTISRTESEKKSSLIGNLIELVKSWFSGS